MITYFVEYFWLGPLLWSVLYISDYWFTVTCARMFRQQNVIVIEGSFELNPVFQKDIDALRAVSPKFLLFLFLSAGLLSLMWYLTTFLESPEFYFFTLGMMISVQLAVHMRHIQNWFLYRYDIGPDGIQGRVEYPRRIILQRSALEFASFAALLLILFALTEQWFFLGGSLTCCSTAVRQYRLAARARGAVAAQQVIPR